MMNDEYGFPICEIVKWRRGAGVPGDFKVLKLRHEGAGRFAPENYSVAELLAICGRGLNVKLCPRISNMMFS